MIMPRWPMPNLGSVQREMKRSSKGKGACFVLYFGEVEERRVRRVVKVWPVGGTNWRAGWRERC